MTKYYIIHDNGGRPFKVEVQLNKVNVFKLDTEQLLITFVDIKKVFIGKSPFNQMTSFSGGYGKKFDGNSILLEMNDGSCVFIGYYIFQFKPLNKIIKFVSPVGNNDVPYPYAIDIDKNYYLLIEDVIVKNVPDDSKNDPYEYYYDKSKITDAKREYFGIYQYYIGNENYILGYNPDPSKDYDRLVEVDGVIESMYIVDNNNIKTELSKKDYIELQKKFGKLFGFSKIKGKKVLVKRYGVVLD